METFQRKETNRKIDQWMIDYIKPYKLYVLRDTFGKALDVSYSKEGLKWATNKGGKFIFYEDAKRFISDTYCTVIGNKLNKDCVVELFIPRNHYIRKTDIIDVRKQIPELYVIDKAMRLLNPMNIPSNETPVLNKF